MRRTATRRSARLIALPEEQRKEMAKVIRVALVLRKWRGESDEDVLRKSIDVHIQAAREDGCDESDVEVIAARARRM